MVVDDELAKLARTACGICGHGQREGEQMNPDGTCPVAVVAQAENELARLARREKLRM